MCANHVYNSRKFQWNLYSAKFLNGSVLWRQGWEFFWLRFCTIYIVSYALNFFKQFLIGPLSGEVWLFRVVLRLSGTKKNFKPGKFFINIKHIWPGLLYLLIIVFQKFDPLTATGMALCVDLGPKCPNLFCLLWD